jgi:hypothetical protein
VEDLQEKGCCSAEEEEVKRQELVIVLDAAKTKHCGNCDFVVTVLYLYGTSRLPSEWHPTKTRRGERRKVNITRKPSILTGELARNRLTEGAYNRVTSRSYTYRSGRPAYKEGGNVITSLELRSEPRSDTCPTRTLARSWLLISPYLDPGLLDKI